ncbi:MAG: invasin domain 3-containing protein, partial [Pseudomonadota bacterium]
PAYIGTSVTFTTSRGMFTNGLQAVTVGTTDTTGTVKVYLYAPLKTNPGNANVTCASNDVTRMVVVEITLYGPPGETAKIVLTASPTSIPADGATPSTITAALTDGNEEPVNIGTSATLTTDKGIFQNGAQRFTDVTKDISGKIIAYLTAPKETKAGPANITCTSNGVVAQTTVTVGGKAASIKLAADDTIIKNDGLEKSVITATVLDYDAKPVTPGTEVLFSARMGEFSNGELSQSALTDSTGAASVTWSAPGTPPGVYQIRGSAEGISATVGITVTE